MWYAFGWVLRIKDLVLKKSSTIWEVSKYGPEKTPYLDNFHAV